MEHAGLAQALSNTSPFCASDSMFGTGTVPLSPVRLGYRLVDSAPKSAAMISKTLGLESPAPAPAPPPPPALRSTNVTVVLALLVISPSETVSLTVNVPGVELVSVALLATGVSITPPVVDQ